MLQRLRHYLTALIFLTACSAIYQNVITPRMEPPEVTAVPPKVVTVGMNNQAALAELFPDGSWQRGSCKQLQSSGGMLLFANWEQISDSQWKLWPVTIVVGRGMSGDTSQDPVIIDASEGAEIVFTESLDVMSGGAPPIRRGRMIGPVHIRRPSGDQSTESLSIRTANVGIDNQKVWTTEAITMSMGEARLAGRDLTIHFSGVAGTSGSEAVLDRMELIYLDELVMPLERGGLSTQRDTPVPRLSLQCGGRVEYDFAVDQLSLRDSVSLVHQVGGQPADRFECEELLLKLFDPTNDTIRRENPVDWLISIVATGSPAHAVLPSFDAEVTANIIDFNAVTGLITANGGKDRAGVRLRRGGMHATLAQLAYQFNPQLPDAIGRIDVQGAGIIHVDDPAIPIVMAKWRDGFQLQPTELTTAEAFESRVELIVDGDIYARLSDGGEFNADAVRGFLQPRQTLDSQTGKKKTTLVPERFQATGNVRIDTSALAAETETLLLDFVDSTAAPSADRDPSSPQQLNPLRQWVSQPTDGQTQSDPVARPRPVIRGDSVAARLRVDTRGVSAKDMSVRGSITVTHLIRAGGQMLPAKLTGERLRLIDDGGGDDILQLESGDDSPARFDMGDGFFIGPMIQIWPSENLIRINAAGEFQMPTAALPTSLTGDAKTGGPPGSSFKWTRPPHCRWNGEMIFDGRTAVLTEGVEIKASLIDGTDHWELQMQGDRLQVDLQQGVQVRDFESMKNATIERVSLLGSDDRPVLVQALRRAGDGVLEAKHLLHAPKFTLTPSAPSGSNAASLGGGMLIGLGRGWYRGWMIATNKETPLSRGRVSREGKADDRLTGVHLIFNDSMRADLTAKSLEFLRGVRVGVRPVDHWDDHFDASLMDAISLGDSTLDCDRLRFMVSPGFNSRYGAAPTPWEMEAVSGVFFRTRNDRGLLEGTAGRAAYASAKDLFTVEGAPNRPAIFKQTLPDGKPGPEGAVKTMTLQPSTMEVKNMELQRLNIAAPATRGVQ